MRLAGFLRSLEVRILQRQRFAAYVSQWAEQGPVCRIKIHRQPSFGLAHGRLLHWSSASATPTRALVLGR